MNTLIDITGQKFGKLTAIRYSGHVMWECQCECGGIKLARGNHLRDGRIKSCGCLRGGGWGEPVYKEGHFLYGIWVGMRQRCFNPSDAKYVRYGARGITVYEPWRHDFKAFAQYVEAELGERPPGTSLDRINNDGNYEPDNLRWATATEQSRNKEWSYPGGVGVRKTNQKFAVKLARCYDTKELAEKVASEIRDVLKNYEATE